MDLTRSVVFLLALTVGAPLSPAPPIRSEQAFALAERDLIPEGMAWDAGSNRFFIGSVYHRKIVERFDDGRVRDFVREGQDELGSPLGMKVDRRRNLLWVCSYSGVRGGSNALYAFDLGSGALAHRLTPPAAPAHLLNDLDLAADGTLYVTDTAAGAVYRSNREGTALSKLLPEETLRSPNGIALSGDGKTLFVADDRGIFAVDARSGRGGQVGASKAIDVRGIDGLYWHDGHLVGVQNSSPAVKARILSISLAPNPWHVTGVTVLESDPAVLQIPTTGAFAGAKFHFIANSQLSAIEAKSGQILGPENLHESVIRRLR